MAESDYVLGVDLGKTNDPAVFTAAKRTVWDDSGERVRYKLALRVLHMVPLGTRYQDVVAHLSDLVQFLYKSEGLAASVAVDITGVGEAVMELVREDPVLQGISWGVCISGGQNLRRDRLHPNDLVVPKKDLIGSLQVYLQDGLLVAHPSLPLLAEMRDQLLQFQEKRKARVTAFEGAGDTHDDVVMSLASLCWLADFLDLQEREGTAQESPNAPYAIDHGFQGRLQGPSWRDNLPGGH